jgi:hypothetical protein
MFKYIFKYCVYHFIFLVHISLNFFEILLNSLSVYMDMNNNKNNSILLLISFMMICINFRIHYWCGICIFVQFYFLHLNRLSVYMDMNNNKNHSNNVINL